MTSDYTGCWKLLYDYQTLIVGLLAVAAGIAAYFMARRQARAAEAQIRQIQNETRRDLARRVIVAARLIDGTLSRMRDDVARLSKLLAEVPDSAPIPHEHPSPYKPSLSIVWDSLGVLSPDVITNYLNLDAEIDEFKANRILGAGWSKNNLPKLTVIVDSLRKLIGDDTKRAYKTISETEP